MCRGLKGPKKIFRKIETTWQVKLSQQKDAALQGLAGTLASIQKKVHPIVQKIREVSTLSFGQEAAFSSYKYMEEVNIWKKTLKSMLVFALAQRHKFSRFIWVLKTE